jgi:phosphatidylglycerol:prolipoprotein diacylglycerol transferase
MLLLLLCYLRFAMAPLTFPVYLPLGPWQLHPHAVFEGLAFFIGFRLYLRERRRFGDPLDNRSRWSIVAAAAAGGAIGSKVFYWFEDPAATWAHRQDWLFLIGGKTVVGGLVGGLIAVEMVKRWLGIRTSTGDLMALPLAVGIGIGRVGCFLTGLSDGTFGTPSPLPWAVDFGDGIRRHPTQLYEIVVLTSIAWALVVIRRRSHRPGDLFKVFMAGYMACRLVVDTIKPEVRVALGLSSLQWTALAVLLYYAHDVARWLGSKGTEVSMTSGGREGRAP